MQIAPGLLTVKDFDDALLSEAVATRALIPEDMAMSGLFTHEGAGNWAYRRCVVEFAPIPGQVVTVRKSGHGVRPVMELAIRDRVLYRALVRRWKDTLTEPDRSSEAYDAFRRAPLADESAPAYVVSSDVVACYQYIDHGLLARELLARTGDSEGVEALTSLLGGLTGRSFGLPQQSGSSDALAEAYLATIERRLLRQGLKVWRYNDDFRIGVGSWSEALNAVDVLERECRAAGLALNDSKTFIRKRKTYEESLDRRAKILKQVSREVELDLTLFLPTAYDDVIGFEPEPDEVAAGAARRVVAKWLALEKKSVTKESTSGVTSDDAEQRLALSDLLPWALPVLQTQKTERTILTACGQMLKTDQTLTPHAAKYLAAATSPKLTISWFERFLSGNPYLTPWQAWWVAPAIGRLSGSYAAGSKQRTWLESVWSDTSSPEPVKAGLAFTMAQKGLVTPDELMAVYDGMTETGRPYVARALGAVAPAGHTGAATLLAEDEWVKWAFELGRP